jgi:hypothetical protein
LRERGVLRVPLAFSTGTKAARQNPMAEMAIRGLDESVAQIEDKR